MFGCLAVCHSTQHARTTKTERTRTHKGYFLSLRNERYPWVKKEIVVQAGETACVR